MKEDCVKPGDNHDHESEVLPAINNSTSDLQTSTSEEEFPIALHFHDMTVKQEDIHDEEFDITQSEDILIDVEPFVNKGLQIKCETESNQTEEQVPVQTSLNDSEKGIIYKLIKKKFTKLPYREQLAIKHEGRPKPDLNIEIAGMSRGKPYKRQFNRDIYLRNNWICGCNHKNALFCFPCVLFANSRCERLWTVTGVRDLVHLTEKIKTHQNSKTHISNDIQFALFGSINIQAQLDSDHLLNFERHNEEVSKNRYILTKIINCIKFCGAFELALHDESENLGIFRGLINFSSELDKTFEEHLKNAPIFKNMSNSLQNYILNCMLEVCQAEIIQEIDETPVLSVITIETTESSPKFQLATIFRYVNKNGDPIERFWSFLLPTKRNAETVSKTILDVIDPVLKNDNRKLIAQSYDGAALSGVQERIKQKYESAHFVYYYALQLNSVMSRACTINSQVRVFFEDLQDIPEFITRAPERLDILNKIVKKNKLSVVMPWNFHISTINFVYKYRDSIMECMGELEEDPNAGTCKQASGIQRMLQDPNFIFWLTFFHYVMPHVDVLYNQLQKTNMEPSELERVLSVFEQSIKGVRNKIDCIIMQVSNFNTVPSETKRRRPNNNILDQRDVCTEICDVIINNAKDHFAFTGHLEASSLLLSEKFVDYFNKFPEEELDLTCSAYKILNKQRLRTELSVLYSNHECRKLHGAVPFLKFIISNNLDEALGETKKLLQILVTTPMITVETERNFSTVNHIKTFLKNSVCEDQLTALAMLSIEKKFISSIPDFNEKVIDKFAANKEDIPLKYKKTQ